MGLGGRVQILLAGADSARLTATARQLEMQMRGLPKLVDISSTAALRSPQILVVPDPAMASEQGVSVASIARTAMIATIGDVEQNLAKFDLPERQINIRVQIDPKFRHWFAAISNLRVQSNTGNLIPLSSVALITMGSGPAQIDRFDRQNQVTISGTLVQGYTLGEALRDIKNLPAYRNMPADVTQMPTGDVEIQQQIFGGFAASIAAAVLFIYAVLVLLFNDFLQPFTIMMSLPMSVGGAALGLLLFHQPLGLYALIGIVMLMGLVTKNAILLVEYILMSMHNGVPREEAILSAGHARMRPILMTTVAMIVGMVPIALGLGAGAEVRSPMAVSVIGGLITSTFLTLVLVPVVFTYVDDARERIFAGSLLRRRKRERKDRRLRRSTTHGEDAK
jgi:hydrophobic/amphiphilic exporter-1 (mainly G- bacteria), HAE1 family